MHSLAACNVNAALACIAGVSASVQRQLSQLSASLDRLESSAQAIGPVHVADPLPALGAAHTARIRRIVKRLSQPSSQVCCGAPLQLSQLALTQ